MDSGKDESGKKPPTGQDSGKGTSADDPRKTSEVSSADSRKESHDLLKESGMKAFAQLPERLAAVTAVMKSELFSTVPLTEMFQDFSKLDLGPPGNPFLRQQPNAEEPPRSKQIDMNPALTQMFGTLRPLLSQVSEDVGRIRLMLSSKISDLDLSNITDEEFSQQLIVVMSVLSKVEEYAVQEFEAWAQYHVLRSQIVLQLSNQYEDGFKAVNDLDCKLIMQCRSCSTRLVELYMTVENLVEDVIKKIDLLAARVTGADGGMESAAVKRMFQ